MRMKIKSFLIDGFFATKMTSFHVLMCQYIYIYKYVKWNLLVQEIFLKKTIDTEDLDKNGIITQGSKTFM